MKRFFTDLKKYKAYIFHSAKAQLKSELANSWLGGFWWVLEPTLFMFVYMFVFTVVFRRTTEYVVAFIMIGLTYWRFFNNCVLSSITLFKRYRSVASKVYIPKFILVISLMMTNAFKMLCSYIPIIILMVVYRVPLSIHVLTVVPVTLLLFVITFAISTWCMHIGVYVEDLNKLMQIALQMLFYISGIFYPINELLAPGVSKMVFAFNPIAMILYEVRNALLYSTPSNWLLIAVYFVVGSVIALLGVRRIYRSESQYIKVV